MPKISTMSLKNRGETLRNLLLNHEYGVPLSPTKLHSLFGVNYALAHRYAKSGWLTRIKDGPYAVSGELITQLGVVSFLSEKVKMHIGGRSALVLRNTAHYLRFREKIILYGSNPKYKLPSWTSPYDLLYTTKNPFYDKLPLDYAISSISTNVFVSEKERALLEMLDGIPKYYSLKEVEEIASSLTTLRHDVLAELIEKCHRKKVRYLFNKIKKKYGMTWLEDPAKKPNNKRSAK